MESNIEELKERVEKLTDIINWMSNGYGIDIMEMEYDLEIELHDQDNCDTQID